METYTPNSWNEILDWFNNLIGQYANSQNGHELLFRGQGCTNWELETTLERKTNKEFNVLNYMSLVSHCVNEIESFTDKKWSIPDYPEIQAELSAKSESHYVHLPNYDFLVYLRHHGFPSPLLDWSASPYIALYFALCSSSGDNDAAVFCMVENEGPLTGRLASAPAIHIVGKYISTHERHFRQKATYTIATKWSESEGHIFCHHKDVYDDSETRHLFKKLIIPITLQEEALHRLNEFNINHFTLFGTEDSLIKAMEHRLFELEGFG